MQELACGDLVERRSDGMVMTVERAAEDGQWLCVFFEDIDLQRMAYPASALGLVAIRRRAAKPLLTAGTGALLRSGGPRLYLVRLDASGDWIASWQASTGRVEGVFRADMLADA